MHRLHVVVAHRAQLGAGHNRGQIAQHLHRPQCSRSAGRCPPARAACRPGARSLPPCCAGSVDAPGHGQALQRRQRVQPVLRSLHGHVVAHAVSWIEIEVGRGLKAAAQRHQQALRHILLGQPNRLGARAVHIHRHVGIIERLLNARVGRAGNIAHLVQHPLRQRRDCRRDSARQSECRSAPTSRSSESASRCPPAARRTSRRDIRAPAPVRSFST